MYKLYEIAVKLTAKDTPIEEIFKWCKENHIRYKQSELNEQNMFIYLDAEEDLSLIQFTWYQNILWIKRPE